MLAPLRGVFASMAHPDLLVGLGAADDAAVYRVNRTTALVATADFFAPVVDDPYTYGAIAAANAMSDVFAMGGRVVLALNIAAFPEFLPASIQTEILRGGAEKVAEAGGIVAGGHTIWDPEPKFGLCAIGIVHPNRILQKGALRPGDDLYLTKPLGTGVLVSGARQGKTKPEWLTAAEQSMLRLNRAASEFALELGAMAATDVTGFGLLGHLWEMTSASGVRAILSRAALPSLPGAVELLTADVETGGGSRNRSWVGERVTLGEGVTIEDLKLAADPQTSGGLLFALSRRRRRQAEELAAERGLSLWRIGSTSAGQPGIEIRAT